MVNPGGIRHFATALFSVARCFSPRSTMSVFSKYVFLRAFSSACMPVVWSALRSCSVAQLGSFGPIY